MERVAIQDEHGYYRYMDCERDPLMVGKGITFSSFSPNTSLGAVAMMMKVRMSIKRTYETGRLITWVEHGRIRSAVKQLPEQHQVALSA